MKKKDIQIRYYLNSSYPCINVKVYSYGEAGKVAVAFGCSEEQAERALAFTLDIATHEFWEGMTELVRFVFQDDSLNAYSMGRSGGWLAVDGLPPVEEWNAIMVTRWASLTKAVRREMEYLASDEYINSAIEGNQWYKEYSEAYNFMDTPSGTVCIAELNAYLARHKQAYLALA